MKVTDRIIKIISFSDPKYRIVTFIAVLVILAIIPVPTLEALPNLSICSRVLGQYCYSVGLTRGVSSLLKGDIETAYTYNALAPLVALVIIALIIIDLIKIQKLRAKSTTFYIPNP